VGGGLHEVDSERVRKSAGMRSVTRVMGVERWMLTQGLAWMLTQGSAYVLARVMHA